jgi:hypothetical protein
VSALTAAHFAAQGVLYQELSAQATAIHELLDSPVCVVGVRTSKSYLAPRLFRSARFLGL